jgi:uncharacterized repeat protein (TIGR03803 family)
MCLPGPVRGALLLAALLVWADPVAGQVINIVHSFAGGPNDGQNPFGALAVSGSTFFGMTNGGGSIISEGTVFKVNSDGTGYGLLHSFTGSLTDGANPGGFVAVANSTLLGFTLGGGSSSNGTVFRIGADGSGFGLLHSFAGGTSEGSTPLGSPVLSAGVIYGMTSQGGASGKGTVFKMNADGSGFSVLHSFNGSDGQDPSYSTLVLLGGKLFGMTISGGANGVGCVFSLNTDGTSFQLLHSFNAANGDGWQPAGSLTLVGSTLCGTTRQGGGGGAGTIFKINLDGSGYGIIHTFTGGTNDGADPRSDLTAIGNLLFGTTYFGGTANLGTVFEMNLDGSGFDLLHSFVGGSADGANPFGSPIAFNGSLYGMTIQGGAANDGVIYSIVVPEPSSLVLLGSAAAGGWLFRRRLRK